MIYDKNEHPAFIYFIVKGSVGFFNIKNKFFKEYVEGSFFGEIEIYKSCLRQFRVKAL